MKIRDEEEKKYEKNTHNHYTDEANKTCFLIELIITVRFHESSQREIRAFFRDFEAFYGVI